FFKALNEDEAKITQIKAEDELVYDHFVANMQRAMIKILKEQENG
ncbi:TPA: hypothetical protein R1754_001788, partial [Campylobacter lari]|nr:hypothetical protein [Campylobacter lari]